MTGCFDFRLRASPSVDLDRIHIDHDASKFSMSFSKLFRSRSDGSVKTARSQSEGPTPRARSRPLRTPSPVASASAPTNRRRYVRVVRSDDTRDTRHPSGDNSSSSTHVIIRSRSYSSTDRMRLKKSASADAAAEVTTGPRGASQQRPASSYTPSSSGHTILKKYNHSLDAGTGTLDGATGGGVPAEVSPPNSKHTSFREEVEILEYDTHGKALLVKCVTHTKKLNYEEDDEDEDDSLNIEESFDDDLESTDFSLTEILDEALPSAPSSVPSFVLSSVPIPTPSSVPIPTPSSVPIPSSSSVPIPSPSSVPIPSSSSVPIPSPSSVPIPSSSSVPITSPSSVPIHTPSSVSIPSPSSIPSPVPNPTLTSSLASCIGKLAMEHDAVAEPASLGQSMAQDSRRYCVNRKIPSFTADYDSISAFDRERGLSVGTPSSAPQNISHQSYTHSSKTSVGVTNIDGSCQVTDEQQLPASKSCLENGQGFSTTAISCRGNNSGSLYYAPDSCPDPAHATGSLSTCPSSSLSSCIESSVCNESSSTSLCQPTIVQLADTKQSQPDQTLDFHALVTRGASRTFTDAK